MANISDLEIAPRSVVMQTAKQFAEALASIPQYLEFEQAYMNYTQNSEVQNILQEYHNKQASLKGAASQSPLREHIRQDLKKIQDQFNCHPAVVRYTQAQDALLPICQAIGDRISQSIGLDYGSSCKTGGCCG